MLAVPVALAKLYWKPGQSIPIAIIKQHPPNDSINRARLFQNETAPNIYPNRNLGVGSTGIGIFTGSLPYPAQCATGGYTLRNPSYSIHWFEIFYTGSNCIRLEVPLEQILDEHHGSDDSSAAHYYLSYFSPYFGIYSPLVIDMNHDDVRVSGDDLVSFDIDNDGKKELIYWFGSNTDNGFLVLDLNSNGLVDNGAEMFGDNTVLVAEGTEAPNGFEALAQYDDEHLGGNGDGFVDRRDLIWSKLAVWVDKDADGVSTPNELLSLDDANLASFSLEYKTTKNRIDEFGNWYPYRSWVSKVKRKDGKLVRGPRKVRVVDVYFAGIDA